MALKNGVGQTEQQRLNRSFVIELLRQKRICSRTDLSKGSRLQRATITNIINEFIDNGLVVEDGLLDGEKGRRSIGIKVNGHRYRVIGVMVTRDEYSIGLIGLSGESYSVKRSAIQAGTDAQTIIDHVKHDIQTMIDKASSEAQVLAIGIALPGPYKREQDEIVFVTNLDGWEDMPVLGKLQNGFDIPIFIENDANAGAYAQYWCGDKEARLRNLAYVVAGQGIGCGIISDGEILQGSMGIAGEMGHTSIHYEGTRCECGNRGCLEGYCSLIVLQKNITKRILSGEEHSELHPGFSIEALERAIRRKDPVALPEYEKICYFLSVGIVNMINQINPNVVIIGDRLAMFEPDTMLRIVRENVRKSLRPLVWESLQIEISQLEHNPILVGAGAIAAKQVFTDPMAYVPKMRA